MLRNALITPVTTLGMKIGYLMGGAVVIEVIFNLPGMGMAILDGVSGNDPNLIMGVVIVVALTAIASFSVPNETMATSFRMLKYFFIFMAAMWGLYGFFLAWLFLIAHLCSLESFGEPYLMPDEWERGECREKYKDYYLRLPLFLMWKRPVFTREGARVRRNGGRGCAALNRNNSREEMKHERD